jgi:hypothetical protein
VERVIEEPGGARFALEGMEGASVRNGKPIPLKRLGFTAEPGQCNLALRVRAVVRASS